MKSASLIYLSHEEVAGPRSNKRRLSRQGVVPMFRIDRTAPRFPLRRPPRRPRFLDSRNRNLTRSHPKSKTRHRPNKRLTPLYSPTTTPRHLFPLRLNLNNLYTKCHPPQHLFPINKLCPHRLFPSLLRPTRSPKFIICRAWRRTNRRGGIGSQFYLSTLGIPRGHSNTFRHLSLLSKPF